MAQGKNAIVADFSQVSFAEKNVGHQRYVTRDFDKDFSKIFRGRAIVQPAKPFFVNPRFHLQKKIQRKAYRQDWITDQNSTSKVGRDSDADNQVMFVDKGKNCKTDFRRLRHLRSENHHLKNELS